MRPSSVTLTHRLSELHILAKFNENQGIFKDCVSYGARNAVSTNVTFKCDINHTPNYLVDAL